MSQTQKVGGRATIVFGFDGDTFVKYHHTTVVKFNAKEIVLDTGGWRTVTTKLRMNQASNQFGLGFQVFQKAGFWFLAWGHREIRFIGRTLRINRITNAVTQP